MSETLSAFDLLDGGNYAGQRAIKDELSNLEFNIRRKMDAGLAPDEMAVARSVQEAVQAASTILEKVFA